MAKSSQETFHLIKWSSIVSLQPEIAERKLIKSELPSGTIVCAEHELGRVMLEGEFHSMNELYKVAPDLVPKPHAWGQLKMASPETYYYLCDFVELVKDVPDPILLCEKLVALHRCSASPSKMFGFHIKPLRGNLPLDTTWNPSWKNFFVQLFRGSLASDQAHNGRWSESEQQLAERAMTHVVPQVLGPLEADGRSVKPSLIHGGKYSQRRPIETQADFNIDLWDGNIGTDSKSGQVYVFDASSYYAHHELEIAIWRSRPNTIVGSGVYLKVYLAQMGISEPADQFDDRHMLYSACTALHAAACHDMSTFRNECLGKLKALVEKYAPLPEDVSACVNPPRA
ncbi:hypothetical protein N0V90_003381 [Kalmusia sp. IMI 367209]|nr:hypothetical protein N0V90_003381 [Kalmusia sp. IMI 367209]